MVERRKMKLYFLGQVWEGFRGGFLWEAERKAADSEDTQNAYWSSQEVLAPLRLIHKVWRQRVMQVLWYFSSPVWNKSSVSVLEIAQILSVLSVFSHIDLNSVCTGDTWGYLEGSFCLQAAECKDVRRQALKQNWNDAPQYQTVNFLLPFNKKNSLSHILVERRSG